MTASDRRDPGAILDGPSSGRGSASGRDAHLPRPGNPWTPIQLTRWSGAYLQEKGVEGGRLDAEHILAHVLGLRRLDLYLQHDRPLLPGELEPFKRLLRRRAAREPLQHVLGTAPFRGLDLVCDSRALIPRPETEVLVEEVLAWTREAWPDLSSPAGGGGEVMGRPRPLLALDIGTGSGAISLALLVEGPFGKVVGTDTSPSALSVARENAERNGVSGALELRAGSLFDPIREGERFHVLVSNPPYVPEGDRPALAPEVRDWEPGMALFAGPEGLDVLLPLVEGALDYLLPGGLLALEVGCGQAGRVARAVEETGGFREIRIRPDLAGRERVVLGVA